ncbi:MAG: hypothetical protein ACXWCO_03540 [Caldimonas sp.]
MTPQAYLVGSRTAAARQMVEQGVTDQALIAERSGFGSRSSLYRALASRAKTSGRPQLRRHGATVAS